MRHPLALTADLALRGRKDQTRPDSFAPRPPGEVVWLHIGLTEVHAFARPLIQRLMTLRPGTHVVLTRASEVAPCDPAGLDMVDAGQVPETSREAKAFLTHFAPDMGLWMGGDLVAAPLAAAAERSVPLALIAAMEKGVPVPGLRWRSSVSRALLRYFSAIHTETANAERRLAAYGLDPGRLHLTGPMQVGDMPPNCVESDLDALRETLGNRFLWAGARITASEMELVLNAHAQLARFTPRTLAILHPEDARAADALTEAAADLSLGVADWDAGDPITEATELLMTRDPAELGLWHRLAPISVMGGSFVPALETPSPWPAASLGSAILSGPHLTAHADAFSRLRMAGAARVVSSADELFTALSQLSAPDSTAAMAHAGWQIATTGAAATDQVVAMIQDTLDGGGTG
ncbi:3-deoxy-D-manno-octulosonic acid transferase [Pseudaestuariivita sp.]|uniref:3-deoxy-D-manno-octulosonic acid transferase n=1 Tax=Pseudaestuariivita sp. TaxID=2211669 RepID=UPI00405911C9